MNIQKILFPTDFSKNSNAVLDFATSLARDMKARLVILHVAEPVPPIAPDVGAGYYGVPQPDEGELRITLEGIAPSDLSVSCEHQLVRGDAATSICDVAREQEADLIVMGTHGRTGLPRLLMGSIAESVMRHAPCPVLTLKLSDIDSSAGT